MDQVNKFVEPGKQFFKDSYRLVKKCTKPDRKGISTRLNSNLNHSLKLRFNPQFYFRVSKNRVRHRHRLRHHGIHWLLRQTHPHPNQQHHRVS